MNKRWAIFWLGATALLGGLQSCGGGGLESLFITADDERAMGDTFNMMVEDQDPQLLQSGEELFVPKTAGDSALYKYYQGLGQKVVNAVDDDDWGHILATGTSKKTFFKFQIIKSPQVNAFAVPGGYVYFYTSIFKEFSNEAELMAVLSHEIGHIVLHHSREAMLKDALGSAVIDAILGDGNLTGTLGDLGWGLAGLASSRENEFEADSMGIYYTTKAGVSPTGIASFFTKGVDWRVSGGDSTCVDPTGTAILGVFSTHPPSCDRIDKAKERVSNLTAAQQAYPANDSLYKAMVGAATLK